MGVTLFEIVSKHMSLQAGSGDMDAFKTDVDQAVVTKAGQLDGTAALLRRDPQPPASPLNQPAATVFPIVVCGNHFPVNPLTRKYVEERLHGPSRSTCAPSMAETSWSGLLMSRDGNSIDGR
jgi:hypothetical protein